MIPSSPLAFHPLVLLLMMTLSGVAACSRSDAEPAKRTAPAGASVEVAEVRTGAVERRWSAVGSLKANESVIVRPEIAGRISRIGFEEGQRVNRGVALFELDDSVFLAEVARAQANLVLSGSNAKRSKELFERGLISAADRDSVRAAQELDEASLRLARAQAAKTVLVAPFAGNAGLRGAAVGDYVNPGQDLVVLEDLDRVKLEFRLPELAMPDIEVGQSVEVNLDAYPGETFKAQLYALDSRVADDTRSIGARALLDNPDGRLRPGMFARVNLVVSRKENALLIPEQALLARGGKSFVYTIDQGKAVETEVQLGQRQPGQVEILKGLSAGQVIVTSGLQRIGNGAAVKTAPKAQDAARESAKPPAAAS
ncbi:efflux RND transporter periplasmic adaptor subunit [Panacagrimonas perspica]|nr:efflux RND transporter periplasmic adaptor subunit [Panacagrimonas perspica]